MSDGMSDMREENAYEEQRRLNLGVGKVRSDGSTASYYELPNNASELQDLISAKNMNAQIGEIFRECYRYGQASHSDEIRGIKKILFYAKAELERLQKLDK
jgi:Flp pilus assembly CpaF family ATPase